MSDPNNKPTRRLILETAIEYTCGPREQTHGSPEDNYRTAAALWNVYIEARTGKQEWPNMLSPRDAAVMMALLKIARIAVGNAQEDDHYIDAAAYMAIAAELENLP